MTYREYRDSFEVVDEKLSRRDILEGLAEEAAELSQAALKLIRAEGLSPNVTPVDEATARQAVLEEFWDVLMYIDLMDFEFLDSIENPKWLRWAERLKNEHTV